MRGTTSAGVGSGEENMKPSRLLVLLEDWHNISISLATLVAGSVAAKVATKTLLKIDKEIDAALDKLVQQTKVPHE